MNEDSRPKTFDLIIVGAGPAGLSAAAAAKAEGLNYLVIEQGLIGQTIYKYPVGRTVFSTINELELRPGTLHPARDKPTREELLSHYVRFALEENLRIHTEERVLSIERRDAKNANDANGADNANDADGFLVQTSKSVYEARRVMIVTGIMAHLRRLDVPGEELPKVKHLFIEAYQYVRKDVMVIGGGNSAAEAALFLAEEGAHTTLVIWRRDWENRDPKKNAIKHWVREPLEAQIAAGSLNVLLYERIIEIKEAEVVLQTDAGEIVNVPNDAVFVLIGSDADQALLRAAGVKYHTTERGEMPVYDAETFETNISGLYIAGHFTHARHMVEAIAVPRRVVPQIARSLREGTHEQTGEQTATV